VCYHNIVLLPRTWGMGGIGVIRGLFFPTIMSSAEADFCGLGWDSRATIMSSSDVGLGEWMMFALCYHNVVLLPRTWGMGVIGVIRGLFFPTIMSSAEADFCGLGWDSCATIMSSSDVGLGEWVELV
jgi:hypothetical protein